VEYAVGGMTCSMCSSAIHKALTSIAGIQSVTISLATNIARVTYIESKTLTAEIIAEEIEDIGYDVNDIIQKSAPSERTRKTVEYAVGGMTCSMCSSAVTQALKGMPGVEAVDVSLSTNTARIQYYDDDQVENDNHEPLNYPDDFKEMIEDIGYDVTGFVEDFCDERTGGAADESSAPIELENRLERILRQQDSQLRARRNDFLWSFAGTLPILIITMLMPRVLHEDNFVCRFMKQRKEVFGCSLLVEAIIVWLLATPVQFVCGYSFYKTSFHGIRRGVLGMDVLVSIGTTSSYIYAFLAMWKDDQGYRFFETSAVLISFVLLGKWMNAMAVRKTSQALTQLMKLQAKTAIKISIGSSVDPSSWNPLQDSYSENVVPIQQVKPGDIVKILRGANVPADGIVLHGELTVDQSMITGESIPVLKSPGDNVLGGTICAETGTTSEGNGRDNALTAAAFVRVTGVGADSALSQIVQMVQEAQSQQVPIQKLADGIASVFVPVVVVFSLLTFLAWLACCKTGVFDYGEENPIAFSLKFGIATLVISCPCALGLATPTAVMVGTGVGARHGILMKGGETLEVASKANVVLFDKTGTLTKGKPAVTDFTRVASDDFLRSLMSASSSMGDSRISADDIFVWLLGSLERNSEHILATAIVKFAEQKIESLLRSKPFAQPSDFVAMTGRGASGIIDGNITVSIGNRAFADRDKMAISSEVEECMQRLEQEGKTAILAGINGTACAVLGIADEIKKESPDTIRYLRKLGMDVWMVTGDSRRTAHAIARQLDLPEDRVIAEALPNTKIEQVRKLQRKGKIVCMVGDGVNDAPALAEANVGISMGTGSDIAAEASDMVLVGGNVSGTCTALHLSRAIFRRIQWNFVFSMGYNVICIPLAAGILYPFHSSHPSYPFRIDPTIAAIAMALSSVSVVFSSLALRLYKPPDILSQSSSSQRYKLPEILRLRLPRTEQEYEMVAQEPAAWSDNWDELV